MNQEKDEFLPTRRTLLSRLRAWDDRESWNEFFNLYGKLIFSVARKMGLNPVEAEDAVQETIISVAKEMPEFRYDPSRGSFKGWLKLITQRRIADYYRKKPRELLLASSDKETDQVDSNWNALETNAIDPLEKIWDAEWCRHVTEIAMRAVQSEVSQRQYQIFDLHVAQGLPVAEVTRLLGVSSAQVYLTKHRLSRLLKQKLKRLEA